MNQFEGLFDDEEWLNQNMDLGLMEVDTEDSTDSEAQVGSNGKKRNSYTIDYKLEAIDYAKKQSSINSASKHFNVDRKCIRKWMAQEEQLRKKRISTVRGGEKKELDGAGRPLLDPIFDKRLAAWVRETRATGTKDTLSQIVREAQRLQRPAFGPQSNTELKMSHGWLMSFIHRHKFSARKETRRCQKPPAEYAAKIADFVVYISKLREQNNYLQIYACDETAVWLDPTSGKCVDYKGAKDVTVVSTGHEKARVTVMLTARADGTKSRPYVLLCHSNLLQRLDAGGKQGTHISRKSACSINGSLSGVEDDFIHCMKPEGSVSSARDLLRKARGSEVQLLIQEELDEEEDYNNGYESNAEIE
ncbi:brinker DNA-binding domain-containing protein [Ditylenchus destructor]|uniref:Brinker DNA-binding domain-containing protein n=1 Tax=Ditylenchus destructor TaxID=166010 RepID=A0AAD4NF02_9BILA|nr:brinker DNA-binding domain-containing protein [Ditylenchus destructor]